MANALKIALAQRLRWPPMLTPSFSGLGFCHVVGHLGWVFHLQVRVPQGGASRQRDGIKEGGRRENPRNLGAASSHLGRWVDVPSTNVG